jgi:hypothetical protein
VCAGRSQHPTVERRGGGRAREAGRGGAHPGDAARRRRRDLGVPDEIEAVLEAAGSARRRPVPPAEGRELGVEVERQVERHRPVGLPREQVDHVVGGHHHRPPRAHAGRDVGLGVGPAQRFALVVGQQAPVDAGLRAAVDERRLVGEGAAVPVQRALDVAAGAHVVQPAHGAVGEQHVQPVGVAVAAAAGAVVEADPHPPAVAPEHGQPLRVEQHRAGRDRLGRGRRRAGEQQRLPPERRPRERGRRLVALRLAGGAPAAGVAGGRRAVVERGEGAA